MFHLIDKKLNLNIRDVKYLPQTNNKVMSVKVKPILQVDNMKRIFLITEQK